MKVHDLIVIGAGPAGVSAAIYAQRAGIDFILIEKAFVGGQLHFTSEVENYPGVGRVAGDELAKKFKEHLGLLNVDVLRDEVVSVDSKDGLFVVKSKTKEFKAQTVIVAAGSSSRRLNIQGEEEFSGKGVSYCAVCDGFFFKGKDVCVIGGGNHALEEALYLSGVVNKVYLVHRRDQFRGFPGLVNQIQARENIETVLSAVPVKISGEDRVSQITLKNKKTDQQFNLDLSGVFVSIGRIASCPVFTEGLVEKDENGFIVVDRDMKTKTEGLFVCGDVRSTKTRQIVVACSEGVLALFSAIDFLNQKGKTF